MIQIVRHPQTKTLRSKCATRAATVYARPIDTHHLHARQLDAHHSCYLHRRASIQLARRSTKVIARPVGDCPQLPMYNDAADVTSSHGPVTVTNAIITAAYMQKDGRFFSS